MNDAEKSHVTTYLPDTGHKAAEPGTAFVRLETTHERRGVLDGAWWPRSRDIGVELPRLIAALTEYLGPVTRVGLDLGSWDDLPARMLVEGQVVHIDSSPVADDTVLVTRGEEDHFSLMVVPPDTEPDVAHAAMARAVRVDNTTGAERILIDTVADPG
jgi:Family of unknown function (DUF5994)